MAELDPIIQDLILNAAEYVAGMDEVLAVVEDATSHEEAFTAVTEVMTHMLNEAGAAANDLAQGFLMAGASEDALNAAAIETEAIYHTIADTMADLKNRLLELAAAERLASDWDAAHFVNSLGNLRITTAMAAAAAENFRRDAIGVTQAIIDWNDKMRASTGAAGAWIRQWSGAIHWIVMGGLEILATAIPALVALGAAMGAMMPTFTHIADQMNYLRAATGSWSGVMAASVGPLQAAGAATVRLRAAVAPDAYIIFGSAINSITGHVGVFSKMAQQASNVLAQFASKLSAELAGPLGGQLAGFFSESVKFMVQWGQVLGNIGHTFIFVMNDMWHVSHVVLDVFDALSRVLLAIASNPVGGFLIGLASALSAVYRWGLLVVGIFRFMGGAALIGGIAALAQKILMAAEYTTLWDAAVTVLEGEFMSLIGGTVGLVTILLLLPVALDLFFAATQKAKTATDNLIASVNKMPPTMANLNAGMFKMAGNLTDLRNGYTGLQAKQNDAYQSMGRFGTSVDQVSNKMGTNASDVRKTIAEWGKLAAEAVNLATGMAEAGMRTGQIGAAMQVMAIQTALADSKITQINQAIDQYLGLLTGATSGNANFISSMSNLGSVVAHVSNNLGTSTVTLSLNAKQFGDALSKMGTTGAAAWQSFDQVMTGSIAPLMDTLRQFGVVGALTGQQVSQAAIDMAVELGRFAGSSKTAQAQVMGFLRSMGLTFPSFQKFMQDARRAGAGQHQLTGLIDKGTIAFSKLSQMAKNAAVAMNPLVANAIDKAALQASGFNTKLGKLQTDMSNGAPSQQIQSDMAAVNTAYQEAIKMAERTGNSISQNATSSSDTVHESAAKMARGWDTAKLHQLNLQGQVHTSSANIGQSGNTVASQMQAAMAKMSTAFDVSRQHAIMLQNFINSMHGKNITVTTTFSQSGNVPGAGIPGVGNPGGGGGGGGQGHRSAQVVVHVHGSVQTSQSITRAIQAGLNQKTIRNASTQLFIAGRKH